MRQWTFCLGLTLTGALVPGARAAPAQDVASLQGTFAWDSTAGDDVAEAIEAALADLNVLHRRFARGHLQRTNQPHRTVTIEQDEETISIATDGGEPITALASGEPIEWTRGDGKRMRVSIVREDGQVRQAFTADDEVRENSFRLRADGRGMIMAVTVRIDRLPDPIRYELVYRQAEDSRMRQYLWGVAGPGPLVGTFLVAVSTSSSTCRRSGTATWAAMVGGSRRAGDASQSRQQSATASRLHWTARPRIQAKARWDDGRLRLERRIDGGGTMIDLVEALAEGNRLLVIRKVEGIPGAIPEIRLAFDRAE